MSHSRLRQPCAQGHGVGFTNDPASASDRASSLISPHAAVGGSPGEPSGRGQQSARGGESDEEKSTSRGGSPKDAASGGAESAEFTVNCSAPTVEASTATIVAELGDLRADVASMREASHVRDRKLDFILAFVKEMAKTD